MTSTSRLPGLKSKFPSLTPLRACALALALVALLTHSALTAKPAEAFSGATGATGCTDLNMADNASHTFFYIDLTYDMKVATSWARKNVIDPTDVTSSAVETSTSATDVLVRDRYYEDYCGFDWGGMGVVGLATCDSLLSGSQRCEQHTVRYNNNFTGSMTGADQKALACHENGHALGLEHTSREGSCLQQGYPKPYRWDSTDINSINTHY